MTMPLKTNGSQDNADTSRVNRMEEGRKKGQEYEVLLLALFLERGNFLNYNFEGGFQLTSAGKFDDIIFKYNEGTKVLCRYFQLKHRLDTCDKITANILLAKDRGKNHNKEDIKSQEIPEQHREQILKDYFNLTKYFKSFRDIKKRKLENELKDITVFTNIDLDCHNLQENGITTIKIREPDNILGPDFQGSQRFKLKINQRDHPLYTVLKEISNSLQLASTLAKTCISKKVKTFSCDLQIYKLYHIALINEKVLEKKDKSNGRFTYNFIDNIDLSPAAQNFRKLFETECLKLPEIENDAHLWQSLKIMKLKFGGQFGETSKKTSSESTPSTLPISDEVSDVDIDEFLDHLVLAVKQPNVEEMLDLIIKPELKENLELIDSNFIANVFRDSVYAWMNAEEFKKKGGFIPGEKVKTFFEDLKKNENLSIANYTSKVHREKLMNFQIEFKSLNELEEEMAKDNQIIHIKTLAKDSFLSSVKVHQYLRNKEKDRFFFSTQDPILNVTLINDIFKKRNEDILVIECKKESSESIDKLLDCLSVILPENPIMKVILISCFDDEFICKLKELFPDKCITVNDNFSFKDLTQNSKKRILSKKLIFQGRKTKLEDIIQLNEDNLENALNWQTVTRLLQRHNEIKIGEFIPSLSKVCPYYMARIILSNSGTVGMWGENETEFLSKVDRNVIIAAESGMGKSTLILSISEKWKNTSDWKVMIDLNKYLDDLKKVNDISSFEKAISVLIKLLELKTSLETEIFRFQCIQGNVLIFFDGYDEIDKQSRKIVLQLIKMLKEKENIKVWIFTRNHLKKELEDELSILSHSLQPFSHETQKHFLKKYWSKNISVDGNFSADKLEHQIKMYANEIVTFLYIYLGCNYEKQFFGIPLHIFMVAEIFQDEIRELLKDENKGIESLLPTNLNLLIFFEKFVKKKFEIVKHEKCKIDRSFEYLDSALLSKETKLREIHSKLAIKMLFTNEMKDLLGSEEVNIYEENITPKDVLSIGIIDTIDKNNNPHFIYRSFAEYFASVYFYENRNKRSVKRVIMDKLFNYENRMIRRFFDHKLAGDSDIHLLLLNNIPEYNIYPVENINTTWDLTKTDEGGRTPLHLAAALGELKLLKYFLGNDFGINVTETDINMKDSLLNWSPLRYADKLYNLNCAELLLEKKANKEDLVEIKRNVNHYFYYAIEYYFNPEPFNSHLTVSRNLLNLTTVLVEAAANLKAKDLYQSTPLYLAADEYNTEIMEILKQHNCDLNGEIIDGETVRSIAKRKLEIKRQFEKYKETHGEISFHGVLFKAERIYGRILKYL